MHDTRGLDPVFLVKAGSEAEGKERRFSGSAGEDGDQDPARFVHDESGEAGEEERHAKSGFPDIAGKAAVGDRVNNPHMVWTTPSTGQRKIELDWCVDEAMREIFGVEEIAGKAAVGGRVQVSASNPQWSCSRSYASGQLQRRQRESGALCERVLEALES